MPPSTHTAVVEAWLAPFARSSRSEQLKLFEAALETLWARTKVTLGEITMTAIFDRVLHNAAEKFPFCALLEVDAHEGIRYDKLRESGASRDGELGPGIRFVLIEFLTVLGNLTAEILTPALHAALAKVSLADAGPSDRRREAATRRVDPQT